MRAVLFVMVGMACLVPDHTYAKRIYKSVDEEGHVTYSSKPPQDAKQIEKLFIPESFQPDSPVSVNTTHDEIKAAAEQLEKDRKLREQERENARIKAEKQQERQQAQQPVVERRYYYPVVPLYHHHHHRPRPPRPPLQPLPQQRPPGPKGYQYKTASSLDAG